MNIMGHIDRRRYNPSRDLAYVWPQIAKGAIMGFEAEVGCPVTQHHIQTYQLTEEELGEAAYRLAQFFKFAQSDEVNSVEEAMQKAGFTELSLAAQAAILVRLGMAVTGAAFYAIRDVVIPEDAPMTDKMMAKAGDAGRAAFARRSWWKRLWRWVSSWWSK